MFDNAFARAMTRLWQAQESVETLGRDRGSNSVETAVIVGVVGAAALALAGLMVAAIKKYGAQIP